MERQPHPGILAARASLILGLRNRTWQGATHPDDPVLRCACGRPHVTNLDGRWLCATCAEADQ